MLSKPTKPWLLDATAPDGYEAVTPRAVQLAMYCSVSRFSDPAKGTYCRLDIRDLVNEGDAPDAAAHGFWRTVATGDRVIAELVKTFGTHRRFINPVIVATQTVMDIGGLFRKMQRSSAIKGLLAQGFGRPNAIPCNCCESRLRFTTTEHGVHVAWPFYDCISLPGYFGQSCGNYLYHETDVSRCTYRILSLDRSSQAIPQASEETVAMIRAAMKNHVASTDAASYIHPLRGEPEAEPPFAVTLDRLLAIIEYQRGLLAANDNQASAIEEMLEREFRKTA